MAVTVALTAATATFTLTKNLTSDDTILLGNQTYKAEETPATVNDFDVGADQTATIANIVAAVNGTGTPGLTTYYTGTLQPPEITAVATSTTVITFTSKIPGAIGNNFICREGVDGGTAFTCSTFSGGSGAIATTGGFIESILALNQVNSEVAMELKKLTYAED